MSLVGTVKFEYWLDDVMPNIAGAEVEFVLKHIRDAAIAFCEQSLAWRVDALPANVIVDQRQYQIDSPWDDTEIVQVMQVFYDDRELLVASNSGLSQRNINFKTQADTPRNYVQEYAEKISLYPLPNSNLTDGLTCQIALRPSRFAIGMNDSIGKKYFEAIANGAKARLYEIPNKPWTDAALSGFHRNKSEMMAIRARDDVASGYGRGPKRVVSHT